MATLDDVYPRKIDLGRVAQRTVWVLGRQPVWIFGLALILHGLPTAYSLYGLRHLFEDVDSPFFVFHSPLFWGHSIVSLLISVFLEATIIAVTVAAIGGRPLEPRDVLVAGGKFFLPLFAVNLLAFLGIAAGCILLVVPGIMLALAWMVVGPALVVERTGITEVFARSAELTRNNRWRLFALLLIYVIANSIIGDGGGYHYRYHFDTPMELVDMMFSPVRIGIRAILGSVMTAIALTAMTVVYVELRTVKEGAEPTDLEEVFT
jgi:hypothetical protein